MFTVGYTAPELLQQERYGIESDYWSIGVVAFMLLSGEMPFWHKDLYEFMKVVKAGQFKFDEPVW